jgi:5-methylcytosine-specific restriction protein A
MIINELPDPVTASKADWNTATTWMGFTPTGSDGRAHGQCESTVKRQFGDGYVLEYITESLSEPNPGFESHPVYLEEKEHHANRAGRIIGVHKLRQSSRALVTIIGDEEYRELQDIWAKPSKRYRWSVAFPIVESYEVVGSPKAKDVFGDVAYRRLYAHQSATLRPLGPSDQAALAQLSIASRPAANSWVLWEDEFEMAQRSEVNPRVLADIERDLTDKALEGFDAIVWAKIRRRAAWLAERFARERTRSHRLSCDHCGFDPEPLVKGTKIRARSLLDVHHKNPIGLGVRLSQLADFALLCPTCHRLEHSLLRVGESLFSATH